jgi:hypothetical protein
MSKSNLTIKKLKINIILASWSGGNYHKKSL